MEEKLRQDEQEEKRKESEEEENRKRREEEEDNIRENARKAKELEAAALRETLNEEDQIKFDEMVARGMLLSQIILYFMAGGAEECKKAEIREKIRCAVQVEEVGGDSAQNIVIEKEDTKEEEYVTVVEKGNTNVEIKESITEGNYLLNYESNPKETKLAKDEIIQIHMWEEKNIHKHSEDEEEELSVNNENDISVEEKLSIKNENNNIGEENLAFKNENNDILEDKLIIKNENNDINAEAVEKDICFEEIDENKKYDMSDIDNRTESVEENCMATSQAEINSKQDSETINTPEIPDIITTSEDAKHLEQGGDEKININSKQDTDEEFAVGDDIHDDKSIQSSFLDEDETLIQDVDNSDLVEDVMSDMSRVVGGSVEAKSKPEVEEESSYVSIVDRVLGRSWEASPQSQARGRGGEEGVLERNQEQESQKLEDAIKEEKSSTNPETDEEKPARNPIGLKVAMDRVLREKSAAKEMSVPRELASQLLGLSSANISDELKKSCSNIVARSMEQDTVSEKKYLLARLEELLNQEKKQVNSDLKARRKQLGETTQGQREELTLIQQKHNEELKVMRLKHQEECCRLENHFLDRADHLRKEVELLENEMESMASPSQLASLALDSSLSLPCCSPAPRPLLSELEQELQCCGCQIVCRPPTKIFQCPEGDLVCGSCLPPILVNCPDCGCGLQGQTSRNKVLEKLALKHFAQ